MNANDLVHDFLAAGPWAVAGASNDRGKYGNKVLRCYLQSGRTPVYPVNPRVNEVEGLRAYPDLASLPAGVRGLSIITPPAVTEGLVEEAGRVGIGRLWMQPGAESRRAIELAREQGLEVIAGGPCLLVVLGFREEG